jgi:hypothetical protein
VKQQSLQIDRQERIIAALQSGDVPEDPVHEEAVHGGQESQHLNKESAPAEEALDQTDHQHDVPDEQ